ncbi:MAG: serine/threonine-protein kinase [Gemmatales bacterium]|nr:serine/threonine protein kinase [Gemmatales bacterium]MDW8175076.1 serine/threonine-protein kinase [Gemmatales bacterium]
MIGHEKGACEWFVWDLRRSNLLEPHLVEELSLEYLRQHPGAEPQELAEYFVAQGLLTRYQADCLLHNRANTLVVGPYVLHEPIGTGSMGTVYRARSHQKPDQWFAVKILPRRSMWNIRLAKRQVREFESFSHPAVVPFADVGTSGGLHYLVWPYVEGETLDKLVAREGKLGVGRAVAYIIQAAEGLLVCHERGLVHAIVKPSNILLTPDEQICLLDFGVGSLLMENDSESVVDTMSSANALHNNLDCASPESIADPSQIGPASDQYSLGCVLYFLLSGQYPFAGRNAIEKMMAHQTQTPKPLRQLVPEIPEALESIIQRMLVKKPSDRYPTLLHVMQALRVFLQGPAAVHAAWSRAGKLVPGSKPRINSTLSGSANTSAQVTPLPSQTLRDPGARCLLTSSRYFSTGESSVMNPGGGGTRKESERGNVPSEVNHSLTPVPLSGARRGEAGRGVQDLQPSSLSTPSGYSPASVFPSTPPPNSRGSAGNANTSGGRRVVTASTSPQATEQNSVLGSTWFLLLIGLLSGVLAYYLASLFL